MKPPGWLVMEYVAVSPKKDALEYRIRIRTWHPGWWLFVLRHVIDRWRL